MAKHLALIVAMLFIPALAKADSVPDDALFTFTVGSSFTFLGTTYEGFPLLPSSLFTIIRPNDLGQTTTWDANGSYIVSSTGVRTPISLPTGCIAFGGVNDSGQVAGFCMHPGARPTDSPYAVGFIDTAGSLAYASYTAPNDGSAYSTYFLGINNAGEVIGSVSHVPEPPSLLLLVAGLAALGLAIHARGNRWTVESLVARFD
jgi:hypothetical protein